MANQINYIKKNLLEPSGILGKLANKFQKKRNIPKNNQHLPLFYYLF